MAEADITYQRSQYAGAPFDVEAIEHQLSNLWKKRLPETPTSPADVPTRTSVLNLVVCAVTESLAERTERVVDHLSIHHPSRIIYFAPEPGESPFETKVEAHLTIPGDNEPQRPIVYEQIAIATPPDALPHIPSIINSLVLPDLPTFIWWPGQPPLHDRQLPPVIEVADRLIVDTVEFNHCLSNLVRMAGLHRKLDTCGCVCDLNWRRLDHWRQMIAQFFDMPAYQWALDDVDRLIVEYGQSHGAAHNPIQALLLTGWATSRLGWELTRLNAVEEDGTARFLVTSPGGSDVSVELRPKRAPRRYNGQLLSATLHASDGRTAGTFEAARIGDLDTIQMTARVAGTDDICRAVHSVPRDIADLLVEELRALNPDQYYEQALIEAQSYAELLNRKARA